MAVTKAKDEKSVVYDVNTGKGKVEVHQGASGGVAPEGYGLANIISATSGPTFAGVEGVAERTKEQDDKRYEEAEKFQRSKVEFEKKVAQAKLAQQQGKDSNPVKDAIAEEKHKQDVEAAKKPTAVGAETHLDNPAVAQSAEATKKEEEKAEQLKKEAAKK